MAKLKGVKKKGKNSSHSVTKSNIKRSLMIPNHRNERQPNRAEKTRKRLNAIARLELLRKGLDNRQRDLVKFQQKKDMYGITKTAIERDSRICKERKIRRSEIMAKTRGRGLRVRHTTWSLDSYIQCRS